jgi:hypothetical protein
VGVKRALALLLLATVAHAVEGPPPARKPDALGYTEPPDYRFTMRNAFGGRYNPLGLELSTRAGLQARLYHKDSPIVRSNYVFIGMNAGISPTQAHIGPLVEVQPISILSVKLITEVQTYFGDLGYAQSFVSARDNFSDSAQSARENSSAYATTGFHLTFEPVLLVPLVVKPKFTLVLQNRFSLELWKMKLHGSDNVFYEAGTDTLVGKANGLIVTDDADLVVLLRSAKRGAATYLGVRYSMAQPFYNAADYRPGEASISNANHRIGPLVGYTFFDHGYTYFNKPTLIAIINWYFIHPYRTGADVSAAVPYMVLALTFQSDFFKGATR